MNRAKERKSDPVYRAIDEIEREKRSRAVNEGIHWPDISAEAMRSECIKVIESWLGKQAAIPGVEAIKRIGQPNTVEGV